MSAHFFSNRDLVRNMLSLSKDATPLLSTSKQFRNAEPCATYYDRWAERGCPPSEDLSEDQSECLNGIGGLDSPFCVGEYKVSRLDNGTLTRSTMSVQRLLEEVRRLMQKPKLRHVTTTLIISISRVTIRLQRTATNLLVVTHGWRQRVRCRISDVEFDALLATLLTQTGSLLLPCQATTIDMPRSLGLHVCHWDDLMQQEFTVLMGRRE